MKRPIRESVSVTGCQAAISIDRCLMVTPEDAAEARRCLPHVEDDGVRYILQKIADCYPAPEEPTLPMGSVEGE